MHSACSRQATFTLGEDEMEIGMGIHGEPGTKRTHIMKADELVDHLMEKIVNDLPYESGDEVAVMINGLGATPLMEQFIMNRRVSQILNEKGIKFIGPL